MKAISVLFGGNLKEEAFKPLNNCSGKSAFVHALEQAKKFPYVEKVALLGLEGAEYQDIPPELEIVRAEKWTRRQVLETISRVQAGFDLAFYAWADCPFLDPALAAALADRHLKYAAEYSYADGFPYGFAPELLSPGIAGILYNIDESGDVAVDRDALFQAIQKDINAFDIETEISPVDLRPHRLCLAADSKRNLLLINRWLEASTAAATDIAATATDTVDTTTLPVAADAAVLIDKNPQILRTLPSFYNIQACEACAQTCAYCPWPKIARFGTDTAAHAFMPPDKFNTLLEKIIDFSSDAVISLSLWGEIALHPQKMELIKMVLEKPQLSLVLETSGIGWKTDELTALSAMSAAAPKRTGVLLASPLSWVVSLDAHDPNRYKEVRGPGFTEASACAKQLLGLFPGNVYVQAVRFQGAEDDIEAFYRYWKETASANQVIIQKYDHFCGKLPKLQASDLSPVKRRPCWHLLRDMCVAIDGTVLRCREDLNAFTEKNNRPNVFTMTLSEIWNFTETSAKTSAETSADAGICTTDKLYLEHSKGNYPGECADCDEYYTYNF